MLSIDGNICVASRSYSGRDPCGESEGVFGGKVVEGRLRKSTEVVRWSWVGPCGVDEERAVLFLRGSYDSRTGSPSAIADSHFVGSM